LTTALIGACIIIFIITRIMYPPAAYDSFLQHPTEMDKFALDIELIQSNKAYYY